MNFGTIGNRRNIIRIFAVINGTGDGRKPSGEEQMSDKIMNFNLNGAGIIEASAGTGKTYTITGLICRLLLGIGIKNGEPVDYTKLLVMTFTKAATSDMKRKIGERIRDLRCFMESLLKKAYAESGVFSASLTDSDAGFEMMIVQAYLNDCTGSVDDCLKKLVKGIRILNRVELNMDNMQISTIHSFCRQIISRFVVDTGLSWQLDLQSNDDDLRKRALYECIRREMITDARGNDEGYANIYNDFLSSDTKFNTLLNIFRQYKDKSENHLFNEKSFADYGKLHTLLLKAFDIYEKLKAEEKVINNDDLLLKLKDALVPGADDSEDEAARKRFLARKIKQMFPVAIIDEFQDTDPVQFEIVRSIYLTPEDDGKAVISEGDNFWGFYIVGDPKQSIYGFRNADLYCYTCAKNIIRSLYTDEERSQHEIELSVNYRSDANMVKAVNCIFSGRIPEELDASGKTGNSGDATSECHFYDSLLNVSDSQSEDEEKNSEDTGGQNQIDADNDLTFTNVGYQNKQKFIYIIPEEYRGENSKNSSSGAGILPEAACNFVKTRVFNEQNGNNSGKSDKSGKSGGLSKDEIKNEVAVECADMIVQLLNYGRIATRSNLTLEELNSCIDCRRISLKDITVLISNKNEAANVLKSLKKRNVPVVFLSDRTKIFETEEYTFISLMMNAVLNNSEQDYLRLLLASRVFGLSGSEYAAAVCNRQVPLDNWTEDISDAEEVKAKKFPDSEDESLRVSGISMETLNDVLVECKQIWVDHGFMAMFTHFTERFNLMERIRNRSTGAEIITNLLHCSEIILNLSTRISDLRELIENYDNLKKDNQSEDSDEGSAKRLTDDNDEIVKITTYHSSKGLEYNIVLMPYADSEKSNGGQNFVKRIVRIRDKNSDTGEAVDVKNSKDEDKSVARNIPSYHLVTSAKDAVWTKHLNEEKLESHRLWYVALTRACHALFLWYTPEDEGEKKNPKRFCLIRIIFEDVFGNGRDKTLFNLYGSADSDSVYFRFINDYAEGLLDRRNPGESDYYYIKKEGDSAGQKEFSSKVLDADAINTRWKVFSYSSLVSGMGHSAMAGRFTGKDNDNSDQTSDEERSAKKLNERKECRFAFPKGSRAGTFLHEVLEHLDFHAAYEDILALRNGRTEEDFLKSDDAEKTIIYKVLENKLRANGFAADRKRILDLTGWFEEILAADLCIRENNTNDGQNYISLKDLDDGYCIKEMEFWLKVSNDFNISDFNRLVNEIDCRGSLHPLAGVSDFQEKSGEKESETMHLPEVTVEDINGLLTGFIDLIFKADGRYYVADYKSNYINDDIADYDSSSIRANMINHHYYIQYILYTLALHRYLKLHMPDYDYDRDVGGIAYLYLRGMKAPSSYEGKRYRGYGVFANRITSEYIEKLDALFS